MDRPPLPRGGTWAAVRSPRGPVVLVPWALVRAECARARREGGGPPGPAAAPALARLARGLRPDLWPD